MRRVERGARIQGGSWPERGGSVTRRGGDGTAYPVGRYGLQPVRRSLRHIGPHLALRQWCECWGGK
jgi:hypothetical protein